MLFCRPRSRHPLGWRLGNCRHSAGGRPKDREHPGAARSRRLARRRAHPFSADSQVCRPRLLRAQLRSAALRARTWEPRAPRPPPRGAPSSPPRAPRSAARQWCAGGGGGYGGGSRPGRAACGSWGCRAGRRGARPGAELRPRARPPLALRRPAGAAMEVYIPSFRYEESDLERGYTVFKIEVLMNGRKHFVEKRYSEFHALHKKKLLRVCGLWPLPSPKPAVWSVTAGSVSIITSAVSASTLSDDDTSASPLRFHWLYLHTPG
ncbi:sorting nexin-24 isoform X3 [Panthera onca]